jgi:hypothetical protein
VPFHVVTWKAFDEQVDQDAFREMAVWIGFASKSFDAVAEICDGFSRLAHAFH